jgi:hypothetical protein
LVGDSVVCELQADNNTPRSQIAVNALFDSIKNAPCSWNQ